MTLNDGKVPKVSKAARAGVAMSIRPWGVLDKAKRNFNPENGVRFETDVVFTNLALSS
jgi:hypothetical protein